MKAGELPINDFLKAQEVQYVIPVYQRNYDWTTGECKRELVRIKTLEINVAYPFLLQLFEDAENGLIEQSVVMTILKLVQTYVWRRFIVGLPTNALN
jgi:uncharacterized protein with ParB-like and HNH nuclease domain